MREAATRPALSVMTPVYDGEQFVQRCYFMLRSQTFEDWEWVVVNDGSTDRTLELIQGIDDPRIQLVSYRRNRGRGYARHEALEAARGDWVVVWDVDDVYFPDRLEEINQARVEGYDFCCSHIALVGNDLGFCGIRGFHLDDSRTTRTFVHLSLGCRLELAREIGYAPEFVAGEDAGLVLHLARKYRGKWLQEPLAGYQQMREVSAAKATLSNRSRLRAYRALYKKGILDIGRVAYARMWCRLSLKLMVLNALRLFPALYLKTVPLRSSGSVSDRWRLSEDRRAFLESVRMRNERGDWLSRWRPTASGG
jgi:glycosyltransferase involved in cell wall biosynthesis